MPAHPLDRPVWQALATRQQPLAQGDQRARRFDPAYGPLSAVVDHSAESLSALAQLVATHGEAVVVEAEETPQPPGTMLVSRAVLNQMVAGNLQVRSPEFAFVELGDPDAPEMFALAELTRPGPFAARTHQLGGFVGVREHGRLVAMAGERMKPDGFTEVSAVCTHPDVRGRGLAAGLMSVVAARILARGETPFLHVYPHNTGAIALYEALGYRLRSEMAMTVLAPA